MKTEIDTVLTDSMFKICGEKVTEALHLSLEKHKDEYERALLETGVASNLIVATTCLIHELLGKDENSTRAVAHMLVEKGVSMSKTASLKDGDNGLSA